MDRREIAEGLRDLGLKAGAAVLLHSSYLSLGQVDGGPAAVVGAFLDVLGPEGTLLVPAFGKLGVLVEEVRRLPGAVVSSCPVGTVAAHGPAARELCEGHWRAETAHGEGTPYTRLAGMGGCICLLGVDQDRNTSLHAVEALLKLPYLGTATRTFADPDGREVTRSYRFYPGPHRNFLGLDRLLLESGAMRIRRIGDAQARLIDCAAMFKTLLAEGRAHPDFALCDNPECADCVRQRSALRAAALEREDFRLTASSRLAGRYVPEMIENLGREGIRHVELDCIQGMICSVLPAARLQAAVEEFKAAGIGVSGIRLPCVPDDPSALAGKLQAAGIDRALVPLAGPLDGLAALAQAGLAVAPYNLGIGSQAAADAFARLDDRISGTRFAFNPANFTRAGEKPFGSYRKARFIKIIGQLDVVDCTWDGTPTRLAEGNCEIKELISILRCRSFPGWLCLGAGNGHPGPLRAAAAELRDLLRKM